MSRLIQHTLDEHNQMIILLNRRGIVLLLCAGIVGKLLCVLIVM